MSISSNTICFRRQAGLLQDIKLYYNKEYVKKVDIGNQCLLRAKEYLSQLEGRERISDSDLILLFSGNEIFRRDFFNNWFGDYIEYFNNQSGEDVFDHEHMLLAYKKLRDKTDLSTSFLNGLLHLIAGEQIIRELSELNKVSNKNFISPVFDLNVHTFGWKRCKYITRKYVLPLTVLNGYKGYYYELPYISQIAYLYSKGRPTLEAQGIMKELDAGLFTGGVDKNTENRLAYVILSGDFAELDGPYGDLLREDMYKVDSQFPSGEQTVYTLQVKPNMIEIIGMVMNDTLNKIKENFGVSIDESYIYHVSPYRFGILIRDDLDIKEVLGDLARIFKPVTLLNVADLVSGVYF